MHRLLQGDVGSGKTAVALAALLQCLRHGLPAAFKAPTELLAEQHHRTRLSSGRPLQRAFVHGLPLGGEATVCGRRRRVWARRFVVGTCRCCPNIWGCKMRAWWWWKNSTDQKWPRALCAVLKCERLTCWPRRPRPSPDHWPSPITATLTSRSWMSCSLVEPHSNRGHARQQMDAALARVGERVQEGEMPTSWSRH